MLIYIKLMCLSLLSTSNLALIKTTHLFTIEQWIRLHSSLEILIGLVYGAIAVSMGVYLRKQKLNPFSPKQFPALLLNEASQLSNFTLIIIIWLLGNSGLYLVEAGKRTHPAYWLYSAIILIGGIGVYGLTQQPYRPTQLLLMTTAGKSSPFPNPKVTSLTPSVRSKPRHTSSGHLNKILSSPDLSHLILFSIDQMTDAMLWIGMSGEILYGNQSASRFLGFSATELQSLTLHDITLDFPQSMWSLHWRTLKQCGSLKIETRCCTQHKRPLPVEMTISHLKTPNSQEYQCIIIRDLSDHKQIERALRQRQNELRSLITNIPGAIYRCAYDTVRTIAFISDGIEPIIQYSPSDLTHNRLYNFNRLIHPMDRSIVTDKIKKAIDTQQPYAVEYRLQHQDKSWRWVYDQGQGVFNSNGQLLWLNGALFDITDNKHALEALKASEERLQLALFGTDQGLWDWHIQNHEIYLSPQWPLQLGYKIDHIDGQPRSWLRLVHPADRHNFINSIRQHLLGNTPMCQVQYRMRSQSGQWHWVLNCSKVVRRDSQNQPIRMIGTIQDISDRQLAEERERAKTQQLENTLQQLKQTQSQLIQTEKLSSLGQMVAGIAHEINNPVTFISGNISFAYQYLEDLLQLIQLYQQHYPQPSQEIVDWTDEIELEFLTQDLSQLFVSMEAGASRIKNIVHSLRNFSRLDEAEMKRVDIHEGIDSTLLVLQHRLHHSPACREIQVIKEYGQLPDIECYAGQLNQVFLNLLNNAIDAILEYQTLQPFNSDLIPTILIQTTISESNWIQIQIIDNGLGISEDVQQHLFEPFFTTKPVGKGTGLGLATSYQIIKKHGGKLACHSVVGQGAKFVIEIPPKTAIHLNLRRES
ncbi:MAG: PAS domain-containing protein [Microcoleaceae cyanobacterium]